MQGNRRKRVNRPSRAVNRARGSGGGMTPVVADVAEIADVPDEDR